MKALWIEQTGATPDMALIPDSAVLLRGAPWFIPDDSDPAQWQARLAVGAVIDRLGMHIPQRFAHRYYSQLTVAAHPANATQASQLQWMRDGSLADGTHFDKPADGTLNIEANGQSVDIDAATLNENLCRAIADASAFVTLKTGDLILLPVPMAPIQLAEGNNITVKVGNTDALTFKTR